MYPDSGMNPTDRAGSRIKDKKMKRILKKDIKGINLNYETNMVIDAINAGTINTYDMQGGFFFNSIMEITYFLLKNGNFEKSRYFDGNPFDFKRISWYLSDIFNATVTDTQRMMRSLDLAKPGKIMMSERYGLNTFEILNR